MTFVTDMLKMALSVLQSNSFILHLTSVEDSPSKFLRDPASFKEVLHAEQITAMFI